MSYTPINWQTGDTITAEKLNRCDNGWLVESSSQQLFSETVTTELNTEYPDDPAFGALAYSTPITADTLTVTFDGTDYICPRVDLGHYGGWSNGAPDFTDYPFAISSVDFMGSVNNIVATASAGTYTVSASATSSSIETSAAFETAVSAVVDTSTMPMLCVSGVTTLADMAKAYGSGRIMFFHTRDAETRFITSFTGSDVAYIPVDPNVTATFEDNVFTVTITV